MMQYSRLIFAAVLMFFIAGPVQAKWVPNEKARLKLDTSSKLRSGMSEEEVFKILGRPSSEQVLQKDNTKKLIYVLYWDEKDIEALILNMVNGKYVDDSYQVYFRTSVR